MSRFVSTPSRPTGRLRRRRRFCVVGAGPYFMSGISVYTYRLVNALSATDDVSAILMRRLLPRRFYPGRQRVGAALADFRYNPGVRVFDGVDWYWLPSILGAIATLVRQRPDMVIFQWWSGTVLHSYLLLAIVARLLGARVVIEFHEVLDTAEAKIPVARTYVGLVAPLLIRLASAFAVHSSFDRELLAERYPLHGRPVELFPHGPYDHYTADEALPPRRDAPADCCNLLFFGVIRPFKGLEDLIRAFDAIPPEEIGRYWLTVVGETWEGWTLPAELIAASPYRDRITFVNRYVEDAEIAAYLAGADALVLPYHRSSMSGPLQTAMGVGLPVVTTSVGGLVEAVADYPGAILVPPADPERLRAGLARVAELRGRRFTAAHSWDDTAHGYAELLDTLAGQHARGRTSAQAAGWAQRGEER